MKSLGMYRGSDTEYKDGLPKDITPEQLYKLPIDALYDLWYGDEFVRIWEMFGDPILDEDLEI